MEKSKERRLFLSSSFELVMIALLQSAEADVIFSRISCSNLIAVGLSSFLIDLTISFNLERKSFSSLNESLKVSDFFLKVSIAIFICFRESGGEGSSLLLDFLKDKNALILLKKLIFTCTLRQFHLQAVSSRFPGTMFLHRNLYGTEF